MGREWGVERFQPVATHAVHTSHAAAVGATIGPAASPKGPGCVWPPTLWAAHTQPSQPSQPPRPSRRSRRSRCGNADRAMSVTHKPGVGEQCTRHMYSISPAARQTTPSQAYSPHTRSCFLVLPFRAQHGTHCTHRHTVLQVKSPARAPGTHCRSQAIHGVRPPTNNRTPAPLGQKNDGASRVRRAPGPSAGCPHIHTRARAGGCGETSGGE